MYAIRLPLSCQTFGPLTALVILSTEDFDGRRLKNAAEHLIDRLIALSWMNWKWKRATGYRSGQPHSVRSSLHRPAVDPKQKIWPVVGQEVLLG